MPVSMLDQIKNRARVFANFPTNAAMLLDSVRLRRGSYQASPGNDLSMTLEGGRGEWFIFFENFVRQDYFWDGFRLEPGHTVLDFGANIGCFTLLAANRVGPTGRVIALEPDPTIFNRLEEHVRRNHLDQVELHNAAVWSEAGELTFYASKKNALSSLSQKVGGREHSASDAISVPTLAINDLLAQVEGTIHFAKIDCEGAEYAVFDAIDDTHLARIQHIAMETHRVEGRSPQELGDKLQEKGFKLTNGPLLFASRP